MKNAIEESVELFGYLLLAFGAVESTWVFSAAVPDASLKSQGEILAFPVESVDYDSVETSAAA